MDKEKLIKDIQAEKNIAYTASGDGWHDNPGFNQLEQKEFQAVNELHQLKLKRDKSILIKTDKRNTQTIQIGSIVKVQQYFQKNKSSRIVIWEIVGHQESEIKLNKIAYDTPVGIALIGKKKDENVESILTIHLSYKNERKHYSNQYWSGRIQ